MKLLCITTIEAAPGDSAPGITAGEEYTPTDMITTEELIKANLEKGVILRFLNPQLKEGYWYELAECGEGNFYHQMYFAEIFTQQVALRKTQTVEAY